MSKLLQGAELEQRCTELGEAENRPTFRVFAPPIHFAAIVDSVFVHPKAPAPFFDEVHSLCEKHGLPAPMRAAW